MATSVKVLPPRFAIKYGPDEKTICAVYEYYSAPASETDPTVTVHNPAICHEGDAITPELLAEVVACVGSAQGDFEWGEQWFTYTNDDGKTVTDCRPCIVTIDCATGKPVATMYDLDKVTEIADPAATFADYAPASAPNKDGGYLRDFC